MNFPVRLSPGHIVSILFRPQKHKNGVFCHFGLRKGEHAFYNEKRNIRDLFPKHRRMAVIVNMTEKRIISVLTLGGLACGLLAALIPGLSFPVRFLLAAAAAALIIASVMLNSRVQVREEEKLRAMQRRLEEAESHGSEAVARVQEEAEKRRAQSKEKLAAFYSKTAHSLRIPISVIQGYADLLGSGLIHDENVKREYLSKIRERTEYLNTVLGQLLVEARVQADFSISVWERFDLIELLRQITEDMREAAQKLGIDIQLISDVRRLPFEGDRTRLTRAFYNILENSLKYMNAAGKITVTVSLMEDKQVFLAFKDDGAGMDREEAEHVFELNYQGSNGSHGNGMGLYLVYVTALAHHGTVSARSSPGKGMSIVFLLPQEQGEKADSA